ncbi:MAG: hypothetical protein P8O91_09575 [Luminiphilus sp.]|nr:hypothetical protein [Luminiphilus sp.]
MESNFDIYLTGDILPGYRRGDAVAELAQLFNLETAVADQLLNGTRRRVKKDCNKASALQFRKILTEAGLQVAVQRQTTTHSETPVKATPILEGSQEKAVFEAKAPTIPSEQLQVEPQAVADIPLDYEPIDSVSARPRRNPYTVDVKVALEVAPAGELLVAPSAADVPPVAGVAFNLAPTGELIPTIKPIKQHVNPNTDHLQLAPSKES